MTLNIVIAALFLDGFYSISDRNIKISDFVILGASVISCAKSPIQWLRGLTSFLNSSILLFFLASSIFVSSLLSRVALVEESIWGCIQLIFVGIFLAPTIYVECNTYKSKSNALDFFLVMTSVAGIVSITEYLQITKISSQHYQRIVNPMIGTNGFYIAGLLLPYATLKFSANVNFGIIKRRVAVVGLIVVSCMGIVLGQVRSGYLLAALAPIYLLVALGSINKKIKVNQLFNLKLIALPIGMVVAAGLIYALDPLISQMGSFLELRNQTLLDDDVRSNMISFVLDEIQNDWNLYGVGSNGGQILVGDGELQNVHNVYIQLVYQYGIFGLFSSLAILVTLTISIFDSISVITNRSALAFKTKSLKEGELNTKSALTEIAVELGSIWIIVGTLLVVFNVYPIGYSRIDWLPLLLAMSKPRDSGPT